MVFDDDEGELLKHREIWFRGPHAEPDQAGTAAKLLDGVCGIARCEASTPQRLEVSYDVRQVTLAEIEQALEEVGFHLDNGLIHRLKRALWHFAEENQRESMECEHGNRNCIRAVFVNRYQQLPHGCRDHRPEHWRRYL